MSIYIIIVCVVLVITVIGVIIMWIEHWVRNKFKKKQNEKGK